jgi:hypothetical protein
MSRSSAPLVLALTLSVASLLAQQPLTGTGTIFMGSYSGHITAVEEATEKVSKIPLKTGAPFVVRLSPDRTRFYVESANQEHFEIVDVKKRQSLDSFTLSDARRHVRPLAFEADPQHKSIMFVARTSTRLIDRWEIGNPEFIQYDLAEHKVARTVPWSADFEPSYYSTALRYSPDGRFLYVFGHQILIFDAATMQQVEAWDLSVPNESGMGRLDPGSFDESTDKPGFVTGVFVMRDAVQHRNLLVVGQIDLVAKTVETFPLGPAPLGGDVSFTISPDRKIAHVLHEQIGRHELWTIDMATHRVVSRVPVPSRPRMQVRASSSNRLLYFYEAGRLIEVYSADASKKLRTIALDSDMMYGTFIILSAADAGTPSR